MRRMPRLLALLLTLLGVLGSGALPVHAQEMGSPAIAGLLAQFPSTIAGSPVEVITYRGDEWLAGQDEAQRSAFVGYLTSLGVGGEGATPETVAAAAAQDVALASGVFVNSLGASTALTAIAVCPAEAAVLVGNTLDLYGARVEDPNVVQTAGGDTVLTGVAQTGGGAQIRLMAKANVVWLVDATEPAIPEIMAVIPATSACALPAAAQ